MAENKVGSQSELKVEKAASKKGHWTVGRILTTVIIGFLSFLMVGGTFYYIFSPGFSKKSNAFGFYDGKPIVLENGNVFGRTLMSDPAYIQATQNNDFTTLWQSVYTAYQMQVVYEALSEYAKKAKIPAPTEVVNKVILESGIYNNGGDTFDPEYYKSILPASRQSFFQYVKTIVPYQFVLKDCELSVIPDKEIEFVAEINSKLADFRYFNVNYAVYPDNLAKEYAEEHSYLFDKMDLSIITCSTEEDAKKAYDALKEKSWADVVAEFSEDNYRENEGSFGTSLYANVVASNLADTNDLVKIRALNPDEYSEPLKGPYAYAIYKLNKPIETADYSDSDTLYYVKSVIYADKKDEVQPYIDEAVSVVSSEFESDFEGSAEKYGLNMVDVNGINYNASQSPFMVDVQYADVEGALSLALSKDNDFYKKLFTSAEGDTFGPVETEVGTIFIKVESTDSSHTEVAETVNEYFKELSSQFVVSDVRDSIISSDKHKNNFTEMFFRFFMGDMLTAGDSDTSESSEN